MLGQSIHNKVDGVWEEEVYEEASTNKRKEIFGRWKHQKSTVVLMGQSHKKSQKD
jgi:hypothetical protein